jgi:hypothetical protein
VVAVIVILAVIVASRFVLTDYADWATRRNVVVGPNSKRNGWLKVGRSRAGRRSGAD